ncbi:RNA polymerase sigma factor [Rothia kristinae]|uniref:RNA polymerase sigma factor n=1 Tax=Rothia kristinae TaxID=37923 RepID=UPI0022E3D0DE|nr:sigma-70 family RNA polymerase sigma factor [Rothia kristinae]
MVRHEPAGPDLEDMDLATVVERAQDGDLEAFESLVIRYETSLFRMAYRMLGDRGDAEDVTQETLVYAWQKLETLREPVTFPTWLLRIGANRCKDAIRGQSRRGTHAMEEETLARIPSTAPGEDPHRSAESREGMDQLNRLLQTLPEDQRLVWILRELHGYSYNQLAETLGASEAVIRGRLARTRKNLAKGMEAWR